MLRVYLFFPVFFFFVCVFLFLFRERQEAAALHFPFDIILTVDITAAFGNVSQGSTKGRAPKGPSKGWGCGVESFF